MIPWILILIMSKPICAIHVLYRDEGRQSRFLGEPTENIKYFERLLQGTETELLISQKNEIFDWILCYIPFQKLIVENVILKSNVKLLDFLLSVNRYTVEHLLRFCPIDITAQDDKFAIVKFVVENGFRKRKEFIRAAEFHQHSALIDLLNQLKGTKFQPFTIEF